MAGLGVGGAAAAGLQSGFDMGLRSDAANEARQQRAFENQRQSTADQQRADQLTRANTLQDKQTAQADDDRALSASTLALQDSQYQLGALHAKYPDGNIPDTEAKPLYEAVGQAHAARQAIVAKRYQPIIDATQQKWRDFASRAQTGQVDPSSLSGQDLRDFIQATTGHKLEDFANGTVGSGVNTTTTGMQTQNSPMAVQGANTLLAPQIKQGLGGMAPDGSTIIDKNLYALVPAHAPTQGIRAPAQNPVQGLAAALTTATSPQQPAQQPQPSAGGPQPQDVAQVNADETPPLAPGADPNSVVPVLTVTTRRPDGTLGNYHAPVTDGRGAGADDKIAAPLDATGLMNRMGQLGVVDNWLKTPEMAAKVRAALKDGAPTSFEQAWGMVHGDPKQLAGADPVSQKITAIQNLAKSLGIPFADAMRQYEGKASTGLQQRLDAIDASPLTDDEKATARRVAYGIEKIAAPTASTGGSLGMTVVNGIAVPNDPVKRARTVDFYATQSIAGDNSWQVGLARGKVGQQLIEAVKDRIPEMAAELGLSPQDVGTNKATNIALTKTLSDRQKYVTSVEQLNGTLVRQSDLVKSLLTKGGAGEGGPLFNKPYNEVRAALGSADLQKLDVALTGLSREHQRVLTGPLSNAQLAVSAQATGDRLVNPNLTPEQILGTIDVMKTEAANGLDQGNQTLEGVRSQLRNLGKAAPGSPRSTGVGKVDGAGNPAVVPRATQAGRDSDAGRVLQQELSKEQANLVSITDPEARARKQADIDALQREITKLPATKIGGTGLSSGTPGAPKPPAPGTVMQGFRFKGGNPADKANWERVQ